MSHVLRMQKNRGRDKSRDHTAPAVRPDALGVAERGVEDANGRPNGIPSGTTVRHDDAAAGTDHGL